MTTLDAADWAKTAEQKVLDEALKLAPRHGWSPDMAIKAGAAAGLSQGETELLLPQGSRDLAALLSRRHDAQTLQALGQLDPASMKIRARIAAGALARVDSAAADEAALRRWAGFLSLPSNLTLAARLSWESADRLWRWAGDEATDENHYSKRAILAGVLTGAIAVRLASGREEATAFIDRRIDNVMAFEKWKATTKFRPSQAIAGFAGALGRMRYRPPAA